ncbi:MAG: TIGR04076 family protein [Selenomonadaceae bacterium]|nr:TIGR04076 family protein [Selenomonadaceae bacterium]
MQYKCKLTVIDKKVFHDLQKKFLADPNSGACPFYEVGTEYFFERYDDEDTFWTQGKGAHCSEAWDCFSRYVYTALQGGSIMRGWTNDEHIMIACCNDGTRPVIFKIERLDYKVLYVDAPEFEQGLIVDALKNSDGVTDAIYRPEKKFTEVFMDRNNEVSDEKIIAAVNLVGNFKVTRID